VPLAPDDPALFGVGVRGSWLALRALQVITVPLVSWARYVGAEDRAHGRHVIDVGTPGDTHHRLLLWPEIWHYCRGYAAGKGSPHALAPLLAERAPQVLTETEAADRLGLSTHGVRHRVAVGRQYPVFVVSVADHRVRRHLYTAQVAAVVKPTAANEQRWRDLRALLPDQTPLASVAEHVAIRESPLAVPAMQTPYRQRETLALAVKMGWIDGFTTRRQTFTVTRAGESWQLPAAAVGPWLLGLGDARGGAGYKVAYRERLG
jgi:hypothetical protein